MSEQISPVRHFSITYSFSEKHHKDEATFSSDVFRSDIKTSFSNSGVNKYIYQLERGLKTKRLHYQCYVHLKDKTRPAALAKKLHILMPSCNVSVASEKGITSLQLYCIKQDETYISGPWADHQIYTGQDLISPETMYSWQKTIFTEVTTTPGTVRHINWVYDQKGGIGKSSLVKYLGFKCDIPDYSFGETKDLLNAVSEEPGKVAYIFDLPRTKPRIYSTSDLYSAMESIKNGKVVNHKYKFKRVYMAPPHVWVFSNSLPNYSFMSGDRWKVWEIKDLKLVPYIQKILPLKAPTALSNYEASKPVRRAPAIQQPSSSHSGSVSGYSAGDKRKPISLNINIALKPKRPKI